MKKAVYLILCLIGMSCSSLHHHGLINHKKSYPRSKVFYGKNLKKNKTLYRKHQKGNSLILKKERNEWQYSRGSSTTHRKAMNSSGGYND